MLDHEDRALRILLGEAVHALHDVLRGLGGKAGRRLVEEVEALRAHEDHGEGEGLALATGKGPRALAEFRREEVEEGQHGVPPGGTGCFRERHASQLEVLLHRLPGEDVVRLPEIADAHPDAFLDGLAGERLAAEGHFAARQRQLPDHGLQEG